MLESLVFNLLKDHYGVRVMSLRHWAKVNYHCQINFVVDT